MGYRTGGQPPTGIRGGSSPHHDLVVYGEGRSISAPGSSVHLVVYVGDSLRGVEDASPAILSLADEMIGPMQEGDPNIWAVIIAVCESHIASESE